MVTRETHSTDFIIEPEILPAYNRESNARFQVRNITVGRNRMRPPTSYYSPSIAPTLSEVDALTVQLRENDKLKKVDLPEFVLTNIARYLRENPGDKSNFDCASFIHYVNGIPYEYTKFNRELWDISEIEDVNILEAGDTIVMAKTPDLLKDPQDIFTHAAIYLDQGLFISKFGNKGPLIITTLEEMRKGFEGEHLYKLLPKQPPKA